MKNNKFEQVEITGNKKRLLRMLKTEIKKARKAKTKSFDSFIKQDLAYLKFPTVLLIRAKKPLTQFSFSKWIVVMLGYDANS